VDPAVALTTFVLIFPAELPDKTFVATLVLSTRYPGRWVWLGVAAAFAVQCLVAVTAGGLLSLLPETVAQSGVGQRMAGLDRVVRRALRRRVGTLFGVLALVTWLGVLS